MADKQWMPFPTDMQGMFQKYQSGMRIITEGARAETGQSPKEVIWRKNKAELYHYLPSVERRYSVPILLIYSLINRAYVLDLMPGNSLVEFLVCQGFDVYLLDWGTPGDEDSALTFDNYVLDYLPRVVKQVLRTSQAQEYTLLGYCLGGTLTAMYAALIPAKPLRNLVFLTTPIDFSPEETGLYGMWTSAKVMDPDRLADAFGNIPGELIDMGNRMVKPVTNFIGTYVTMWDRIMQEKSMETWLAMNKWVNDGIPFPGAAFRQLIRDLYQQNKLVKGELTLRGQRVDLSRITCPLLNIAGKKDHICTLPQAEALMSLVSSEDRELLVLDAGHVGLLTGSDAKRGLWPRLHGWLEMRSN